MTTDDSTQRRPAIEELWEIPGNKTKSPAFASGTFKFRGINDLNQLIKSRLPTISGHYDLIVGIPRSGLLAANMIALHLNLPLLAVEDIENISAARMHASRKKMGGVSWTAGAPLRILVVDDSSNSGESMRRARRFIAGQPSLRGSTIKYLAIYASREAISDLDMHFQIVDQPRIFEWNFMHHDHAQNFLFDLDGVLCEDGPPESSESMSVYIDHLVNARPKIIPTLKIGAIVTSRLERYREQTETWLKKYGVSYRYLIMTNLPTAEERRRLSMHGKFKADVYGKLGGSLFVESEAWQAREIALITGKAVYNLENSEYIQAVV